jgi:flagellar biosynthesis protein
MAESERRQHAVALTYAAEDGAPRVVAKGSGRIAEEIIARAREAGIFVHESPELVSLLMQVDLDERIPPALYIAVAELLAWIYRLEQGVAGPPPEGTGLPSTE